MCRELHTLRQAVLEYAGRFDARTLSPAQAGQVVRACAQIEASVASVKALAVARAAEGKGWQHDGYRSAADQLAHDAGMSPTTAKRLLDTGKRMADQPDVARAALAGELSPEQATAVSEGVAANPAKAKELIDKARHSSLPELNEEVARTKALASDPESRRRAIHARRHLRRWTDRDGAMQAHLYGHPEDGAGMWHVLDPIRRRLNVLRRAGGPTEPLDALDYDAMMALAAIAAGHDGEIGLADLLDLGLFPQLDPSILAARRCPASPDAPAPPPGSGPPAPPLLPPADSLTPTKSRGRKKVAGSPARIMIRVDLDTLLRGVPIEGELCEIAGYGPVPVSVIADLMANDNAFLVGLLTKAERVVGVYHHGRRYPTAHQKSALDFMYPGCAVAGCPARAGLQYDHREDYAKTRFTVFDLLDRLCPHHHALKTRKNWALVDGNGKRAFVPPEDPRHPRRAGKGPDPPARSP